MARRLRLAPFGLVLLACLGCGAFAAPVSNAATVSLERGVLRYTADPGEQNRARVYVRRSAGELWIDVLDVQRTGDGCAVADRSSARCALVVGAPLPRVRIVLGDRSDSAEVERLVGRVAGGPGNDQVTGAGLLDGGPGNDQLALTGGTLGHARGGLGDDELDGSDAMAAVRLEGGGGHDRLNGGPRRDILRGGRGDDSFGDVGDENADVYRLGPGSDSAYSWGADTVFAGDGEYDEIECSGRTTVILDALDFYDQSLGRCPRVRRRGLARSWPRYGVAYLEADPAQYADRNSLEIYYSCPYDGARPCAGTVSVYDRRGSVVQRSFRDNSLGESLETFRLRPATLRSLARWGRITVVSFDRLGGVHRHTTAGPNVVEINNPEYCC
jgi:RTX calcium-binding nonapeptide repeat (4 copies)